MGEEKPPSASKRRRRPPAVIYRPGMLKKSQISEASGETVVVELPTDQEVVPPAEPESAEEDRQARLDEIAVIESIYPEMFFQDSPTRIILQFERNIRLTIDMPHNYPSSAPPTFELSGPILSSTERIDLINSLNDAYAENMGMPIIFTWITVINEFVLTVKQSDVIQDEFDLNEDLNISSLSVNSFSSSLDIKHGEVLTDRKSHFQAHLCEVKSKDEVTSVLKELLRNNKIARATHNIYAYRIREERNGREFIIHDCEDDGETGAASKMLDLLDKMGAENVLVVVTRWYGGIHLGPDRFRIINNVTREIVTQHGFERRGT